MHSQPKPLMRTLRGFTLLETLVALVLVGIAMTGLLVTFVGSGQLGVLGRRQANALTVARSIATQLSHASYTDPRLVNNNSLNDTTFADPTGAFASKTTPTAANAPDSSLGVFTVGLERYDVFVNVAPQMDATNTLLEMGRMIAVIVRYQVGGQYMRAVALGYRYNPTAVGVGQLPL